MSHIVRVYGVLDSDGAYQFVAEESRVALMSEDMHTEELLGQIDSFGIPYRTYKAQAQMQIVKPNDTTIARLTDIYEIDLDEAVPADITDVIDITKGTEYPRRGTWDAAYVIDVYDVADHIRIAPDGCVSAPPFTADDEVTWVLSCEKISDTQQHVELLSEHGFAIDLGTSELYMGLDAQTIASLSCIRDIPRSLSRCAGRRGIVAGDDFLDMMKSDQKTDGDILSATLRSGLGLSMFRDPNSPRVNEDQFVEIQKCIDSGHMDASLASIIEDAYVMDCLFSAHDIDLLIDAARQHERFAPDESTKTLPGALETSGWRIPHADVVVVDKDWMHEHGVELEGQSSYVAPGPHGYVDLVYDGVELELFIEQYLSNPSALAIRASQSDTGVPYANVTINLGQQLRWCEAYVDEAKLPGIAEALSDAGLAVDTGLRGTRDGSSDTYILMRFKEDELRRIDAAGFERYEDTFDEGIITEDDEGTRSVGPEFDGLG